MRLDEKTALLTALPTFRVLEPQAVHVLAFSASLRSLQAGEQLFRKDEASDGGYIVAAGRIALNPDGVTPMGAEMAEPGMLIGEAALVAETVRPATAIAVEPSTVLVISRGVMRQVLEAHPDSAARLHAHVAQALSGQHAALKGLAS